MSDSLGLSKCIECVKGYIVEDYSSKDADSGSKCRPVDILCNI